MANALILNVLFVGMILFKRGETMIVLSDGEKWYEENRTYYEPMSLKDFELYGHGAYDNKRMAQVEHYSVDVCYSYHPLYPNNNCATISSTHTNYQILWCFSIIQVISKQDKFCPSEQYSKYVYLTTEEVKTLYKDPKSIWDKANRWCEDNDNKEEDNV